MTLLPARRVCTVLLAATLFVFSTPASASLIVGDPPDPTATCFPFGCYTPSAIFPSTRYQQVYDAGQFPERITIEALDFYADVFKGDTNRLASGTWDLYLSVTSRPVNGLSITDFDSNLTAPAVFFARVDGGVRIPDLWRITGHPFDFDPAAGNLLLDIRARLTGPGDLFLNWRNGTAGGAFSRAHDFGPFYENYGLVTGFETRPSPIPEPATIALLAAGLASLAARRRR